MKKLFAIVFALVLSICSLACAQAEPVEIGVIQLADNGAFTDMREGYIARFAELGYTEADVVFHYQNAQGDMSNLNAICQSMVNDNLDVICTIATPATQAIVNMDSGIPVFFISVSNPVGAGVISDMAAPDKLATGTSNAIPVDEMFALADLLTPGIESYGVIYTLSEINSSTTAANAKAYLEANGKTYVEATVTAASEVQQAAQMLAERVDAFFIPNDSLVQSAMTLVSEVAIDAGIPVYGSSAVMVESGALATVAISDRNIGALTADMTVAYLNGTPIEEIPAVVVGADEIVVNSTVAEALGLEIPQEILESAVVVEGVQ